jgi:ribosome-associated protein
VNNTKPLVEAIIDGVRKIKGINIVNLNLSKLTDPVCESFIICHGESNTQVYAIANSVEKTVKETIGEKAWHKEGLENAQWILIDYANVVVHIFQKEYRDYYKLEDLWADAEVIKIES